jgi:hypothetical protein
MTVSLIHLKRPFGTSTPITIEELKAESCRWPLSDDPPWHFCGLPKARGAYCAVHASVAYRRPGEKEKPE